MPEQKPQLDKFAVAAALQEIAQLMDMRGGQYRFKAKAYNAGARSIQAVANLDKLVREDALTTLPRIGTALASQIKQLYLTGESSVLNELRKEFPPGIVQLTAVPGFRHHVCTRTQSGGRSGKTSRSQRLRREDRKTSPRTDQPAERETAPAIAPASRL
jgi:hypothetical protein